MSAAISRGDSSGPKWCRPSNLHAQTRLLNVLGDCMCRTVIMQSAFSPTLAHGSIVPIQAAVGQPGSHQRRGVVQEVHLQAAAAACNSDRALDVGQPLPRLRRQRLCEGGRFAFWLVCSSCSAMVRLEGHLQHSAPRAQWKTCECRRHRHVNFLPISR